MDTPTLLVLHAIHVLKRELMYMNVTIRISDKPGKFPLGIGDCTLSTIHNVEVVLGQWSIVTRCTACGAYQSTSP